MTAIAAIRPGPGRIIPLLVVGLAVLAAGCGEPLDRSAAAPGPQRNGDAMTAAASPGGDASARLLAADRAFAADVAGAAGADRTAVWAHWFDADGRQLVPGAVVTGHGDIAALMGPAFADPAASLSWDPDLAGGSGDWGWTSGRYVSRRPGPDGPIVTEGRYLTVWRRQADGTWRVAVDAGVPDRP